MYVLPETVLQSLDFTVNHALMKLLKSCNIAIIEQCRYFFHVKLPFCTASKTFQKFLINAANDTS